VFLSPRRHTGILIDVQINNAKGEDKRVKLFKKQIVNFTKAIKAVYTDCEGGKGKPGCLNGGGHGMVVYRGSI
jgi:hypothetical protein